MWSQVFTQGGSSAPRNASHCASSVCGARVVWLRTGWDARVGVACFGGWSGWLTVGVVRELEVDPAGVDVLW